MNKAIVGISLGTGLIDGGLIGIISSSPKIGLIGAVVASTVTLFAISLCSVASDHIN